MAAHALLSPSSAHRWLHCTASPRLEEHEEDKGSIFAQEGTLAHAYCARALKRFLGLPTDGEDAEIDSLSELHDNAMDEHVAGYAATVLGKLEAARKMTPDARLLVETRLDFSEWVPEAFGTADAVIIADGVMDVIDFKYGRGVRVDADNNPQMMIYALGALRLFDLEYGISQVRMTIIQPRLDHVSEWETSAAELLSWAEKTLRPKAKEAWDGNGHQEPGDWCRFCKIRTRCKALANMCQQTQANFSDPRLLTADQIAEKVLPYLTVIKSWVSDVEEYALQQALDGVAFTGWKVVEGRSVRRVTDPKAVAATLGAAGYTEDSYLRPRELKTITDLEKTIGKKRFGELCATWLEKPQGKPTLVPESDKRPPLNSAARDFDEILNS